MSDDEKVEEAPPEEKKPRFKIRFFPYKWFYFMNNPAFAQEMQAFMNELNEEGYQIQSREMPHGVLVTGFKDPSQDTDSDGLPASMPELLKKIIRSAKEKGITGIMVNSKTGEVASPEEVKAIEIVKELTGALPPNSHEALKEIPAIVPRICRKYNVAECKAAAALVNKAADDHMKEDHASDGRNCDLAQVYRGLAVEIEKYAAVSVS